jgi:hypothetical protein
LPYDLYSESGVLLAGAGMLLADARTIPAAAARLCISRRRQAPTRSGHCSDLRHRRAHGKTAGRPGTGLSEEELRLLARAFLALYRIDPNACLGYPAPCAGRPALAESQICTRCSSAYCWPTIWSFPKPRSKAWRRRADHEHVRHSAA